MTTLTHHHTIQLPPHTSTNPPDPILLSLSVAIDFNELTANKIN